ncbi:MAG TPA: ABC transporter ATP-binding protein [Syntrophomonas sp.]|nr:ABC transporter ATP-binding protein [Syntrophomonas sp.]HRW13073.1 ABC transporter ATP-binding protein [Syntrophomonas sp.]
MISVSQASKHFKNLTAVEKVDLQVNKGDIMGLLGPDGAGKTTLLRMICGLIPPDEGEILLLGQPLKQLDRHRDQLGYMPQRFSLYGDLSVMENIYFFGSMYLLKRSAIQQRAEEILTITNLIAFKDRLADQLSGGMKQKLSLTCALITRPSLLILDEPTYGVDPESRKEFWKILYDLNRRGMTLLVSTPYMDEAELCTRVAFISDGKIRLVSSPTDLKNSFSYPVLEIHLQKRHPLRLHDLPGILDVSYMGSKVRVIVRDREQGRNAIEQYLLRQHLSEATIQEVLPAMEDIFVGWAEGGAERWNMQ